MLAKKTILLILDGWGHGDQSKSDAIHHAKTPFIDSLYVNYPHAELVTYGQEVGLPDGQMGNSEVGHLNIGAGRIVYQDLAKINLACQDGSIAEMENLKKAFAYAKANNKALHLMGLVSDGGIHSHQKHLYKLCELAQKEGLDKVFVHAFTDGRDCDPQSGKGFIQALEKNLYGAKIASVCGRYYAMDRDLRWERIQKAYDLLTKGIGQPSKNLADSIQESYLKGISDEFIEPIVQLNEEGKPVAVIQEGEALICFNFRTDRCREITRALTQEDLREYGMQRLKLHYTTLTNYDQTFTDINVIFNTENIQNTLGEVLASNNKTQIRIAETEKYPHVTFFFSGGREAVFEGEQRLMIPSPKVPTYDLQPEMSAVQVTETIVAEIKKAQTDFVCLNFANPDMVGHTGDYNAILKALATVDRCSQEVVQAGLEKDYAILIIADHGNADFALNKDGSPNTAHSTNMVPFFALNTGCKQLNNGKLADIAPTILQLMGIEIPQEMTGKILTS